MEKETVKIEIMERAEMVPEEAKVQKNVGRNIEYIMWKYDIDSQKTLAEILDVGAAQLTRIKKGEQTPTVYPFLAKIKENFHYTIDEFLFSDIKRAEELRRKNIDDENAMNYEKYTGLYQLYHFDSSAFKGRERKNDAEALKSGVLFVCKNKKKSNKYDVIAVFSMKKEAADTCYEEAKKYEMERGTDNVWQYMTSLEEKGAHVYYGDLKLSRKHIYLSLNYEKTRDRAHMIFHRPDSTARKYAGGIGTVVSVSKGIGASPCMQYVAISDTSLNVSNEELANHLLMHYPNLKTYDSIDELVTFIKSLYDAEDPNNTSRLTDEQKKTLVREYLDKIVNETVEKNLFRTAIVSAADDDDFYHYIKRVKANMR